MNPTSTFFIDSSGLVTLPDTLFERFIDEFLFVSASLFSILVGLS
jgi:hypothetical protein